MVCTGTPLRVGDRTRHNNVGEGVIFEKLFPVNLNFELDARNAWDALLYCENVKFFNK